MLGLHTDDGLRFVGHTVPLPDRERARAAEVAFTQLSYGMFRNATRFVRWRPDREPLSCDETQLPDR
jgi:ATP-dependent DNA ligase